MSEFEAQKYIKYVAPVQFEIKQLRAILESAQAKVTHPRNYYYSVYWSLTIVAAREKSASGVV